MKQNLDGGVPRVSPRSLRFLYGRGVNLIPVFTRDSTNLLHSFEPGVTHGYRVYRRRRWPMGPDGVAGLGLQETRKTTGRSAMNSLDLLYVLGGVSAALLLAYLVYALIRAEEF
jgi:K+-transporting ATPase KdpF subunit